MLRRSNVLSHPLIRQYKPFRRDTRISILTDSDHACVRHYLNTNIIHGMLDHTIVESLMECACKHTSIEITAAISSRILSDPASRSKFDFLLLIPPQIPERLGLCFGMSRRL